MQLDPAATTPPPTPSSPLSNTSNTPNITTPAITATTTTTTTTTTDLTTTPPETPKSPPPPLPTPPTHSTPYWPAPAHARAHAHTHARTTSSTSVLSTGPPPDARVPIALEDHEGPLPPDASRALWARSVRVVDYAVIDGGFAGGLLGVRKGLLGWGAGAATAAAAVAAGGKGQGQGRGLGAPGTGVGAGAYVVWRCVVRTLEGGDMVVNKRYSEFVTLREQLIQTFPHSRQAMPELPRKSVISKFRPEFLEIRRDGLEYFLNCILLNPEFAGAPVLKEFLFC